MPGKRYSTTLPNGQLGIISLREGINPSQELKDLQKTLFEINRSNLVNPLLSGDELEEWRMNLHFEEYTGPKPWVARDITNQVLPTDRSRRHAWRDNGSVIFDDITIPDLPIP